MADLTIAGTVTAGSNATKKQYTAGATITQGQSIYLDASDTDANGVGKAKLADADASQAASQAVGIALHGALTGQPVVVQTAGQVLLGTTTVVRNMWYYVSKTAGGICPLSDVTTGGYGQLLGYGDTTTSITIPTTGPIASGVTTP